RAPRQGLQGSGDGKVAVRGAAARSAAPAMAPQAQAYVIGPVGALIANKPANDAALAGFKRPGSDTSDDIVNRRKRVAGVLPIRGWRAPLVMYSTPSASKSMGCAGWRRPSADSVSRGC